MKLTRKIIIKPIIAALFFSCSTEPMEKLVPPTADQDPSVPSVFVNGARLHSEAFGHPDSTILVCIHGGPGSDYRYMLNARDLSDHGYRIVFYDQRGSGLSQRFSQKSYTSLGKGAIDLMYDDLEAVIDHYRTHSKQKVILLGHSWGAMMATAYSGRYPEAVQGLILCEPGGLKWEDVIEYVTKSRSFSFWGELLNDATYSDQFITGKEDQHEILDYKLEMMASKNDITGEDNTLPGSFWRSGAVISNALFEIGDKYKPDFSEGISNFHKPVLFFYSEENKAYPDTWAEKISTVFIQPQSVKISGVGHNGIITDKHEWDKQTRPEILRFLNSF